jgi:hypothetical protein
MSLMSLCWYHCRTGAKKALTLDGQEFVRRGKQVSECSDPPFADRYDMTQHFPSRQLHTIGGCLWRAFSPNAEANFSARKKAFDLLRIEGFFNKWRITGSNR